MPTDKIPIEFEYEGIHFKGFFDRVAGAGNNLLYHLTLYRYHYGQLWKTAQGWRWGPNIHNWFTEPWMLEFFIKTVEAGEDPGDGMAGKL